MEYKNKQTSGRRRYKSRYHSPHNYKTKRSQSENRAAVIVAVATFLVIASLVVVFTFGESIYAFLDKNVTPLLTPATKDQAAVTTEAVTEDTAPDATVAATEAPTQAPTEAATEPVAQSGEFSRLARKASFDPAVMTNSQAIFVETSGTSCTVYTFQKDDKGVWNKQFDPIPGFIGEGGAAVYTVPYDSVTPLGTFNIEFAFGNNPDPGTKLSYNQVYYGMRWITDPASMNYNRMVDGNATFIDFNECQWLHEYTVSYPYAIVFDYNRNPVDNTQGAAKFLHVSSKPTYGGVGISEESLKEILLWLNPSEYPTISII